MPEELGRGRRFGAPVIVLLIGVAGLLLSVGLCGAALTQQNSLVQGKFFAGGVIVLGLSICAFVVGIVWLIVGSVMASRRGRE